MRGFGAVLAAVWLGSGAAAQVVAHPDDLAVTHDLSCMEMGAAEPVYTPADLAGAIGDCVRRGRYDDAAGLMFLFSVYGYFDASRVRDVTARDAMTVLNLRVMAAMAPEGRAGMQAAVEPLRDRGGARYAALCAAAAAVGPPDYVPFYMLAHGLSTVRVEGETVRYMTREALAAGVKRVDRAELWARVLYQVNGCRQG